MPESQKAKEGQFRTGNHASGGNAGGDMTGDGAHKTAPPSITVGDKLVADRYEVLSVLSGGMGVVYKCNDTTTDTVVGLKTVQTDGEMSEAQIRQMRKNYELVHGLSHEHVIRVNILERDKTRRLWFLVMDWVEGEDLESRLRHSDGNRLPADETVRLLRQVARALDYAHSKGVVHRDVKCSNIMVKKEDGNALLIDFGIARRAFIPAASRGGAEVGNMSFSGAGGLAGTPNYQSPEQWLGAKDLTAASDNYSLGVTAYRCLSGHLPFASANEGQLQEMVLHDPVPVIRSLPPDAGVALAKAMAKDPARRYTSCVTFIDELVKGLESSFNWKDFRIFSTKIDRYYDDLDTLKWDRGQTFGQHLDALGKACRAAQDVMDDYPCDEYQAYEFYKQADDEWKWLERNEPLREAASVRLASLQEAKLNADGRQAERYAKTLYQKSLNTQTKASSLYEAGEFKAAMGEASLAIGLFQDAERTALANQIRELMDAVQSLAGQKKFGECEALIDKLSSLEGEKALELRANVKLAKDNHIRKLEEDIQYAVNQYHVLEAEKILSELTTLAPEKKIQWSEFVRKEKAKSIKNLKDEILALKARNDFDDAVIRVEELAMLDSLAADVFRKLVGQARADYIRQLSKSISKSVFDRDFKAAEELVRQLASLDLAEAERQTDYIKRDKARLSADIERKVSNAFARKDYNDFIVKFNELSAFAPESAESQKDKYLLEVEVLVKDAIAQRRFGEAMVFRPLEALGQEKIRPLLDELEKIRKQHIHDLEQICEGFIAQKEYGLALEKAAEFVPLDSMKAEEWTEKIKTAKEAEIERLEHVISTLRDEKRFYEADKTVDVLHPLDFVKAEKWTAEIKSSKDNEIGRLEKMISKMLEEYRMDEAERTVEEEIRPLSTSKADEWLKKIQHTQEILDAKLKEEITRLEKEISLALDGKRFGTVGKTVEQLRHLDSVKADEWVGKIELEKTKEIARLEQLISKALGEKHFDVAIETGVELRLLASSKADEWAGKIELSKTKEITRLEKEISLALGGKHFDVASKIIKDLRPLTPSKADEWIVKVQNAKDTEIAHLERIVSVAVNEERFDDADGIVQELDKLDKKKAEDCWNNIRHKRILKMEKSIEKAIGHNRFDETEDLIRQLEKQDAKAAAFWQKKRKEVVNNRIVNIQDLITEALEKGDFDNALASVQPLAALDKKLYQKWVGIIDDAIAGLKQNISDAIDQFDFDKAYSKLRNLKTLVEDKEYQTWKSTIEKAIEKRVNHLAQIIYESTNAGRFMEAEVVLPELKKLSPMKAMEWTEYVQIKKLEREIQEAVDDEHFEDARASLSKLEKLKPGSSEKWRDYIITKIPKVIDRLEKDVRKAIQSGDYKKAQDINDRLKSLDKERAVGLDGEIKEEESRNSKKLWRFFRHVAIIVVAIGLLLMSGLWCIRAYDQKLSEKVEVLQEELVAQQPAWDGLDGVKTNIGKLSKLMNKASLNSLPPSDIFNRLNASEKTLRDLELSRKSHEELKKWITRIISPTLKAEWKEKTETLRPSEEDCRSLESVAGDFKASLAVRDERLLDVIRNLEGQLKSIPETISKLPSAKHESSLTALRTFISNACYLLFWYDEKNTMGLPFDIDKAWVAVWDSGKTYSGSDAVESCREDAMVKAKILKSMIKNCDQWEDWSQRLWEIADLREDVARRESSKLDIQVNDFGSCYQVAFRKALSEVNQGILQKGKMERLKEEIKEHYKGYESETFQWKEDTFEKEKEWCKNMTKAIRSLAAIGGAQMEEAAKALEKEITGKSDEAVQKMLPVLNQIHTIMTACSEMDRTLQAMYASMKTRNPIVEEEDVKKMGSDLKKMEESWKLMDGKRKALLQSLESKDGLENANNRFVNLYNTLADRLKSTEQGGVTSKLGQVGRNLTSFTVSINNVVRLMDQVNLYENHLMKAKALKTVSEKELDGIDKEMRNIHKMALEKIIPCSKEYPLVQNMLQRVQQTDADWRKTKYALLGTVTGKAEFEKNLEKMKELVVRLRDSEFINLHVQEAVEMKKKEEDIDTEIDEYTERMKALADETKTFTEWHDKQKADVLKDFELLMQSFPKMKVVLPGGVLLEMLKIKGGTAEIGSLDGEVGRASMDEDRHQVEISQIWIGKFEVTQAQYKAIMADDKNNDPSYFKGDNLPVEQVPWRKAKEFCERLTEHERKAGRLPEGYKYSLPMETQWEYACRAGKLTPLNNGRNLEQGEGDVCGSLNEIGWYKANSAKQSHPCGKKKGNSWWLHDMHGNVWEWCCRKDGNYETYMLRGGSWKSTAGKCRSSSRIVSSKIEYDNDIGFRVALVPIVPAP